jgi:2-polyprenyl-3-methyl-5-hydroxy-6-metoxy-1,4-benzoquinol methylase
MTTTIDTVKLESFAGQVVTDLSAAESAVAAYLGDRLGLYQALSAMGWASAVDLAEATGTNERLVLEWLRNQAAGGYVEHAQGQFRLPAEHAAVLADEQSPAFFGGAFELIASIWADTGALETAFRGDGALAWGDHDERLYRGCERFYAPGYRANLVQQWLPALDGVVDRLTSGARVADVGCGYGISTVLMAQAFPKSTFVGYDSHEGSIEAATRRAKEAGVEDRVRFEVRAAQDLPADGFDLVCMFDCLHDMGDPVSAAAAARRALTDAGRLMVVEPWAGDDLDDNINPVGRMFYAGSTFLCTPNALSQAGGEALGAQAGPAALSRVLRKAGFGQVSIAAQSPVNLVLEASD